MPVDCTWWIWTGDYSPFDINGISSPVLKSLDTGELKSLRDLPAGALYAGPLNDAQRRSEFEKWNSDRPEFKRFIRQVGTDGLSIVCVLPDPQKSHWHIDGRASNCTRPEDTLHRCWIRHGTIGERLTVDKNGDTCSAGGGSIAVTGYHGFLKDGKLT